MIAIITAELFLTGFILNSSFVGLLGWIRGGIVRNVNTYIQYLSAINFLSLFILIIIDYFAQGELNVYVAVLTMILGRQTFNSLSRFAKKMLLLDSNDEDEI